jgi:hypothetical protein
MKITKKKVLRDYNILKRIAKLYYHLGLYSSCIDVISNAASLMFSYNIFYADYELELMLKHISKKIIKKQKNIENISKNKVVFYDYYVHDNCVLTEQYLQALIDNSYEILYISLAPKSNKNVQILTKLEAYKKAEIYFAKSSENLQKCNEIVKKIIEYKPSKILYQSVPWDTVGFMALAFLETYSIERYLINLTDHVFWLGCTCADYFLEFRSYGANISLDYRRISENKLFIIPYYPIMNVNYDFQGFPFDVERKKIIVSGGTLYKIYGDTIFLDTVKHILNTYNDTIFFYLGNGDESYLIKFIADNNLQERFYYSKTRKDIAEIIKRCYFYLGTYPICGGLMSQFAVACNKIPIAYTDKKYLMNNVDELFINNDTESFMFYDINLLYKEIDNLLTDKEYYNNKTSCLKNKVISEKEFSSLLHSILENKKSVYKIKKYNIDINSFSDIYMNITNNYLHNYGSLFFLKKNLSVFLIFLVFFKYTIITLYKKTMQKLHISSRNIE